MVLLTSPRPISSLEPLLRHCRSLSLILGYHRHSRVAIIAKTVNGPSHFCLGRSIPSPKFELHVRSLEQDIETIDNFPSAAAGAAPSSDSI